MKVVRVPVPGGPEALVVDQYPAPTPGPHEVLIRVTTAGINRADILEREGKYPPPDGAPPGLGLEVAGTVESLGARVTSLHAIGDRVCALLSGGGYAEYVAVDHRLVLPAPGQLSDAQAGGLMEAACTVWSNFGALGASAGHRILIHGGSGGVGSLATQTAKAMGLWVATTARGPERARRCTDLGADLALDYTAADVAQALIAEGGVDLILDILGAGALADHLAALRPDGAMAIIGLQRGRKAELDLGTMLGKRLRIIGTTLRARPLADRARIVQGVYRNVWPLVPDHVIPVIDQSFPLEEAAHAHQALESGDVFGKVVLTVNSR